MQKAYFKKFPRCSRELIGPRLIDDMVEYIIAETIKLSATDFDNFCADMLVERAFLEKHAALCHTDKRGVLHCLQIQKSPSANNAGDFTVLVMADPSGRVLSAAVRNINN